MRALAMTLLLAPLAACGSTVFDSSPSPDDDDVHPYPTPVCTEADCCPATPPTVGTSCELSDFASCDFGCDGVFECQPVYPEAGAPSEWVKVANGACCPESAPKHGTKCDEDASCTYEGSPWTEDCSITFDAICNDGTWHTLTPASCTPVSSCDPTGDFTVIYSDWSPEPPLGGGGPKALTVAMTDDGKIVTSAPEAVTTNDGCGLQARWSYESCWEEEEQSFCEYEDFVLDINFALETPAGAATYECWGECGAMASASITLEAQ